MNGVAVMMDSPVFREVMAEMVVGLNLFDSAQFVLECGRKYVRDKAQKARKIDDVPVFGFNQ